MTATAETAKLSYSDVSKRMESMPSWTLEEMHLVKRVSFENFVQALAYTNRLGELAEKEQHHPDLMLGWGYVEIRITTHDLGGLTERDFALAGKIDALK